MQSFDHDVVQQFIEINEASGLTRIRTMNLESWEYEYELETDFDNKKIDGIHVQYNPDIITKELVDELHANGKIISVWIDSNSKHYKEDEQFYMSLARVGVDMICTDYPAEATSGTAIPTCLDIQTTSPFSWHSTALGQKSVSRETTFVDIADQN